MRLTRRILIALIGVTAAAIAYLVPAGALGGGHSAERARSRATASDQRIERGDDDPADDPNDVSGPCDEAEHADDPACAGLPAPGDDPNDDGVDDANRDADDDDADDDADADADDDDDDADEDADDDADEDVTGPCDEAEHADDPDCAVVPAPGDDNRGPSANAGPGNGDDDDDHSGPGDGDDDDDHSGPGDGDDDGGDGEG